MKEGRRKGGGKKYVRTRVPRLKPGTYCVLGESPQLNDICLDK